MDTKGSNVDVGRERMVASVDRFLGELERGDSLVMDFARAAVSRLRPGTQAAAEAEAEIRRQSATFKGDVQKVLDGEMSYAEMRGLYG